MTHAPRTAAGRPRPLLPALRELRATIAGPSIDGYLDQLDQLAIIVTQRLPGMDTDQRDRLARVLHASCAELLRTERARRL